MATAAEEVRVVIEVPPAGLDELGVVIEPEASTDTCELVQAVQHLGALGRCRAIGTPQHTGRQLVDRTVKPLAITNIAGPVVVS
ncbi:hypothetical protein ABTW72_13045 [Micromonospora sp. NPDC127501]|uniref:hypothetical protein n=1 Tax=Micromonospora sp. NPDC127501 TaxID=3154872 RepID=UPI003330FA7F